MWLTGLVFDQVYVNSFLTDNTHVTHRACFDFWDFVLTFWKILNGIFSGAARMGIITLVGVYYVLRVDVPIFRGSLALLDPGYATRPSASRRIDCDANRNFHSAGTTRSSASSWCTSGCILHSKIQIPLPRLGGLGIALAR